MGLLDGRNTLASRFSYTGTKYTIQILISTTVLISLGFTALSLPLCHSIFFIFVFDFIENCSGNCECNLATTFHVNHTLDGPMYARGSEMAKCYIFEIPTKNSSL